MTVHQMSASHSMEDPTGCCGKTQDELPDGDIYVWPVTCTAERRGSAPEVTVSESQAVSGPEVWVAAYADHSGIYLYPTELDALRDAVENGLTIVKPIAIDGKRNLLEELR